MNTILHMLSAAVLIAVMIGLRVIVGREAASGGDCAQSGCCRGCNIDEEPGTGTSEGA